MSIRRFSLVIMVLTVAALAISGLAWACSPQMDAISPLMGPVGSTAVIKGAAVDFSPIEIRWNSLSGELVGTTQPGPDGEFAAKITVPDVSPGTYYVVARGAKAGIARLAFRVTPSAGGVASGPQVASADPVSSSLWNGFSTTTSPSAADAPSSRSSSPALAGGIVLLATGAIALTSGLSVVTSRRRRASSQS